MMRSPASTNGSAACQWCKSRSSTGTWGPSWSSAAGVRGDQLDGGGRIQGALFAEGDQRPIGDLLHVNSDAGWHAACEELVLPSAAASCRHDAPPRQAHHNHAAVINPSARISETHHRVWRRHRYVPAELCAHRIAEDLRGIGFAVHHANAWRGARRKFRSHARPPDRRERRGRRWCRPGPYRHVRRRCGRGAIDDAATKRSLRQNPGNQDSALCGQMCAR